MRCTGPELVRQFDDGATPQHRVLTVSEADGVVRPSSIVDKLTYASADALAYLANNRIDDELVDQIRQTVVGHVDVPLRQQTTWKDFTTNFLVNRPRENITSQLIHTTIANMLRQTWSIEYYASSNTDEYRLLWGSRIHRGDPRRTMDNASVTFMTRCVNESLDPFQPFELDAGVGSFEHAAKLNTDTHASLTLHDGEQFEVIRTDRDQQPFDMASRNNSISKYALDEMPFMVASGQRHVDNSSSRD